jgi:Trk-type K+ transport system membrane component
MNTDTWLLIIGGIGFAIIVYQIWRGKTSISAGKESPAMSVSRTTQPVAFWLIIAFQFILFTGLILVFKFLVP